MLPVTHVLPLTTVRRERFLPSPGTVMARVNEKVQAGDVLAQAEPPARHYLLDMARALGVAEKEAARYLRHQPGERVDSGDILAGPVGLARRTLRAPAAGQIVNVHDGRVLFQAHGDLVSLKAEYSGVVVATDGVQSITLEATAALVQAAWGNGHQDHGVLRVTGNGPSDRLKTDDLDINLRGAVLVAGMCLHSAPLHQVTELSCRGLVLGGLASELIPIVRRLSYPVLVVEGFGDVSMNAAAYSLLSTNAGREASVDGRVGGLYSSQRPEVIIPLPATRQVSVPDEIIPPNPGVRVRVVAAPYHGAVGVVREVLQKAVGYPSGILARSARVELEGIGTTNVPLANLEILQ
ncbi:MAG TPA: hypothetical protein VFI11_00785 [Anaerolineales bacterium]|nr:hypothetical protein [Anaerolineales bacterium]